MHEGQLVKTQLNMVEEENGRFSRSRVALTSVLTYNSPFTHHILNTIH